MNKNVIVIGTGGHARVVTDIIKLNCDCIRGFLTTDSIQSFLGYKVLGRPCDFTKYLENEFIIAVGDNDARERISKLMRGVKFYTAVHPSAIISTIGTSLGEGSVVCANVVINPNAHIGRHCILNTSSVVEHDNNIGSFTHISVGAKCAGWVNVECNCFIGTGASIIDRVHIIDHSIIGAGAVVVNNLNDRGVYIGVPAKLLHLK